jgi:hypothetical protein
MILRVLAVIGTLWLSNGLAAGVGIFVISPDSVSGTLEEGRILTISDVRFGQLTSKAKPGDTVEINGEQFEAVVVVPQQVLTVVDKATRAEIRVLVKTSAVRK